MTKAAEHFAEAGPQPLGRDPALPQAQGLYDPAKEHDSCGVGFVANMRNEKSHAIVEMGLQILLNLDHRGAVGADPKLGDGCGILLQIPHAFFKAECAKLGIELPAAGDYAIGQFFLPRDPDTRANARAIIDKSIEEEGLVVLGWRDLPVDSSDLGEAVKAVEPHHAQIFIGRGPNVADADIFERRIYLARKTSSNEIYALGNGGRRALRRVDVVAHHRLQGHGARLAARRVFPRSQGRAFRHRRWRSCINVLRRTRSRPGGLRIPIASSPITAKSTRCAAI